MSLQEFKAKLQEYKTACEAPLQAINSKDPPFFTRAVPAGTFANKVSVEKYQDQIAKISEIGGNTIKHIDTLLGLDNISHHYFSTVEKNIQSVLGNLRVLAGNQPTNIQWYVEDIEDRVSDLTNSWEALNDTLTFFGQLSYGAKNITIIGANGSGKTFLTDRLKATAQGQGGLIIPAQKILALPNPSKLRTTEFKNQQIDGADKKNKSPIDALYIQNMEFPYIIHKLIEDHLSIAGKSHQKGERLQDSKLDETLTIWNDLIIHKVLFYDTDTKSIQVKDKKTHATYELHSLSDGEKVILYFVGQALFAPADRYIIVDEPETFIHKRILYKVWDTLENLRRDCVFIYLTHDLDFVASRQNTNVLWIKSFTHPKHWDIQPLETSEDLPLELLYNIVGSRKPILFFEGDRSSKDYSLYKVIFPDYTHMPVKGCPNVINYTKAVNKLLHKGLSGKGIIDRDHRLPEQIESLSKENIYCLEYSEVENILLSEWFLKEYGSKTSVEGLDKKIDRIKSKIFEDFIRDIDSLAAEYTKSHIEFQFQQRYINEHRNINEIEEEFQSFIRSINPCDIFKTRKIALDNMKKNYKDILKVYNHKGMIKHVHDIFKRSDFRETALKLLRDEEQLRKQIVADINILQ